MPTHILADVAASGAVTTGEAVTFWILAPVILAGAIGMVLARSAVHSALLLACTMLSLGVFYMLQSGPFIGFVQIIVYTGAIMMLFLFVIMLVGRDSKDSLLETLRGQRIAAILLGVGMAGLLCTGLARGVGAVTAVGLDAANKNGNVKGIAAPLFTKYVFAFEVTSALLITAAVGAMVLAHIERRKQDKVGQKETSRLRFAEGNYPGPKPGPGVFATSDSVATPALLPDGTVSERSISPVVPVRELEPAEAAPKGTDKGLKDT
ncbi:MAG TPA: NADH-quinone oxidoreductase subunit J [Stackebrandtia sp.]|jgi:NADH-quinone oxidoreductase subunit J|uniref:NADH-quinone oxidoreductase subunit J n=1 Tax=Stackebrandtia sp. TaxID=2023065 RepID=UPI002D56D633|nr:NADH-quinone oxidoreductase subunit J [Stackebrandtia sp.]HZE40730.1 NADH-quinone oxidoreductase subunit J [Stackebrandtia sp.]